MQPSDGEGERLYFFFAGHGLTARVANRDESALVTPGFDERQHRPLDRAPLARGVLRDDASSRTSSSSSTPAATCRLGRARVRDRPLDAPAPPRPGRPPVQQFILYATSPGLKADESAAGPARSTARSPTCLLDGLAGDGAAKAWSWERDCYEVRWERLADYVNDVMGQRKHPRSPIPRRRPRLADPDPAGRGQPRRRGP